MIKFYSKDNINIKIYYPDIYFTPEYGECCEYSDNAFWELCKYKDLIYVYLKKPIQVKDKTYYELITPYGYSGYYFENNDTYNEFISLFRKEAFNRNYISEVVRQSPYFDIKLDLYYNIIKNKQIFSTEITCYNNYFNNLSSKTRNIIRKSHKNEFKYTIKDFDNIELFIDLYKSSMDKVHASKYYYFNKLYFKKLSKICKIIIITKNNKIVGQSLLMFYNNFIHYHLSCSDYSSNLITNYLLDTIIRIYGKNKKFILGGGLNNNDSLYIFKKKISTNSYNYIIYNNIINEKIYNQIYSKILK